MKDNIRNTVRAGIPVMLAFVIAFGCAAIAQEESRREWTDISPLEIKIQARADARPGDVTSLAVFQDFILGLYEATPKASSCAFPFMYESTLLNDTRAFDKHMDAHEKAALPPHNTLRNYSLSLRSIRLVTPDKAKDDATVAKITERFNDEYSRVRRAHPGEGRFAVVVLDLESLRSPKIESGEKCPHVVYMVRDGSKWKVVWYRPT